MSLGLTESLWVWFRPTPVDDVPTSTPAPAEFGERALRLPAEVRRDNASDYAAANHLAGRLGVNPETLRLCKKHADVDAGQAPGTSSEVQREIKRLRMQIAELEKANEILRSASVVFATKLVCRTMRAVEVRFVTARGYRAAKTRAALARTLSNQLIGVENGRLHAENYGVYGVRKMHRLVGRLGCAAGRDQTGRIMRSLEPHGVKCSEKVFTTKSDPASARTTDMVQRHFCPDAPCRLWVVDVTHVSTW